MVKVFGDRSVVVFSGSPTDEQMPAGFPWALVGIDSSTSDAQTPDIVTQSFVVVVAAEVAGDPMGEFAVIGGSSSPGTRRNRGIGEVVSVVRSELIAMSNQEGILLNITASSAGPSTPLGRLSHVAMEELTVETICTASPSYAAPQRANFNEDKTELSWSGLHCSSRYDFLDFRVLKKLGSQPSQNVGDGTVIYTGGSTSTVITAPTGNTFTVFARYKDRSTETFATSSPEIGSWRSA